MPTVLPHIWLSPSTFLSFRLFSWFIGKPANRVQRLSKLGHWEYGKEYVLFFFKVVGT